MTQDTPSTPPAEVDITLALIASLLEAQHPDLAELPVRIMEAGWDNVMVRLGDELALRLPRRAVADALICNEQTWLPYLSPKLPLPVPVPLRAGKPQSDYPFHWSVLRWLPGQAADLSPPDPTEAPALAGFLKALHGIALPENPPQNDVRDCPFRAKQRVTEKRMVTLRKETTLITPSIIQLWEAALDTEVDVPPTWIAGDIHARNVLVKDGKISAFIDWGDMCVGDPATDLASIWGLLSTRAAREEAQDLYGVSEATRRRAKGWAVFFGVILAETGRKDTPRHARMGEVILQRLHEDEAN